MGDLSEFSLSVRLFLKAYRWRRVADPAPWTPLKRPLSQCRLGLVSSAGFVMPGQPPFDKSVKGGDWSFRVISDDTSPAQLTDFHRSQAFDHRGIQADPNLALPLDRARELVRRGRIASTTRRHLSFMGSISAPGRLVRDSVPAAAQIFAEDQVDVALLVPV